MRVFISYSSAYHDTAESVAIRLREDGHEVFFDRHSLPPGEEFDAGIRHEIYRADLFLFLVTPEAVVDGAYTRTELALAQQRWPRPSGRILPVILAPTPIADIPPYARAVTLLQARGNLVAEIAARVEAMVAQVRFRRLRYLLLAAVGLVVLGLVAHRLLTHDPTGEQDEDEVDTCYLVVGFRADGSEPAGYRLRVSGGGVSNDFSTAADGTASILVIGRQLPDWEVGVIDRDGQTLGEIALSGCPRTETLQPLNDRVQLRLGPRDQLP